MAGAIPRSLGAALTAASEVKALDCGAGRLNA
jgi:hypothetical protein